MVNILTRNERTEGRINSIFHLYLQKQTIALSVIQPAGLHYRSKSVNSDGGVVKVAISN